MQDTQDEGSICEYLKDNCRHSILLTPECQSEQYGPAEATIVLPSLTDGFSDGNKCKSNIDENKSHCLVP